MRYLIEHEWARTAEDILWRRSKLGLHMKESETAALEAWMRQHVPFGLATPENTP